MIAYIFASNSNICHILIEREIIEIHILKEVYKNPILVKTNTHR